MNHRNPSEFLASLNQELTSQADRVRNLIGDAHWLSDGEHKESIVSSMLKKVVPSGFTVGNGFAICPVDSHRVSRQLDVIAFDSTRENALFRQSEFSICFIDTLAAAISVKSSFDKDSFLETLENLKSVANLLDSEAKHRPTLAGIFFDDDRDTNNCVTLIKKWCTEREEIHGLLSCLCAERFVLATTNGLLARSRKRTSGTRIERSVALYDCTNHAPAAMFSLVAAFASTRTTSSPTSHSIFIENNLTSQLLHEENF